MIELKSKKIVFDKEQYKLDNRYYDSYINLAKQKIAYLENNIKEIDNQISLKRDIIAKQDRILNRYKEVILRIKKMGEN